MGRGQLGNGKIKRSNGIQVQGRLRKCSSGQRLTQRFERDKGVVEMGCTCLKLMTQSW